MTMNRRGILGALAASPMLGKQFASDLAQQGTISGGLSADSLAIARSASSKPGVSFNASPKQSMPHWQAARAVLSDPQTLADFRSAAFQRNHTVTHIDPDIQVMRSWSPMAKITFQRQRNVEREINDLINEPLQEVIGNVMGKIYEMLWSKP